MRMGHGYFAPCAWILYPFGSHGVLAVIPNQGRRWEARIPELKHPWTH